MGAPQAVARRVDEAYPWLIDGELIDTSTSKELIRDPATLAPVGEAPLASPSTIDRAVEAASRALPAWAADELRPELMRRAADRISENGDELSVLLTSEQGKPIAEARREIDRLVLWLRHYAALVDEPEIVRDDEQRLLRVARRPLGVVAAITPWNYPISLLGWKLAPALAAGDTVVIRPSLSTPLTTLRLGALLVDVLPAGVVNVIAGTSDVAAYLVGHPLVRKVAFTGSTATGREIMRVAGPALKRVTLELGGNDPAIVLDDADPSDIAERLYWGAFTNCGQICIAIKRLFVPSALHDEIVERLVSRAASTRIGHGLDPATELGPLNNAAQHRRVEALVAEARADGATIASAGRPPPGEGHFFEPTIVSDISPGHPLVEEEQFGPVLPIIRYDRLDAAVEAVAGGSYGLGASIWTADPQRADGIAERLDVGTVWINHHGEAVPDAPFGGARDSGIGYENGLPGLEAYQQLQTRNLKRS